MYHAILQLELTEICRVPIFLLVSAFLFYSSRAIFFSIFLCSHSIVSLIFYYSLKKYYETVFFFSRIRIRARQSILGELIMPE